MLGARVWFITCAVHQLVVAPSAYYYCTSAAWLRIVRSGVSLNSIDIDAIKEAIDIINSIGGSRVSEKFSHAVEKMLSSVREDLTPQARERKIIQTDAVTDARGFEHFDVFFSAC